MAASSSKPTAVHYTMIFFVMTTIIAGVLAYMSNRHAGTIQATLTTREGELQNANTALRRSDADVEELKRILGKTQFAQVTDPQNAQNPATVGGSLQQDIRDYGKELAETTYAGTLAKLREALDTSLSERDSRAATLAQSEQTVLGLRRQYQDTVDTHQTAKNNAEGTLRTTINERDEQIQAKDQRIAELSNLYNQTQVELEQEKEAREKDRGKMQGEIDKLVLINEKIRAELDELKQESFEIPDGKIRRVDNVARMVWIDLGDADFLKPRMSFSIYDKETPGVARTTADVKGKIEVTRVIDAHLAEAKIIEEDIFRPLAPGDFIYTPLWSPGRPEKFAVVGIVDLDGDGKSDRELFRREMAVRGAELAVEVDDDGVLNGTTIDESIKFLIMGRIPDVGDAVLDEDRAKYEKISEMQADLRKQARQFGVRIIPINAFLDYIGYKPKRRVFRPGETDGYNLKAGAASASIQEPQRDRTSSGQVSGLYGTSPRSLPPASSSGATSKIFGGGSSGK